MENYRDSPTSYVKGQTIKNNQFANDIINEYTLKRTSFYPVTSSPNIFITRLEKRMKEYYSTLYNSCNSQKK